MNSRLVNLGKAVVALSFAGCVQAAAPAQPVKADGVYDLNETLKPSDGVDIQVTPGTSPEKQGTSPFRLADGNPDYDKLRQHFGEPNQNIVLNPRAVDVAKTASAHSVTVGSDLLVFDAANAGWLLDGHKAGDVLYCGHDCGGDAFNRKIVSMRNEGGKIFVATKQGTIKDIVNHGWLHQVQLVTFDRSEDDKERLLHDPRLGLSKCSGSTDQISLCLDTGNISKDLPDPHYTKTWSQFTKAFPGGSIGITPSITMWLTFDIDVEVGVGANISLSDGVSLDPIFDIEDLSVTANVQPNLLIQANYQLNKSWSQNWTLVDISSGDGGAVSSPITVGPLTIDPSLLLQIKAEADASAAVSLTAIVTASDNVSAGIGYSTKGGVKFTPPSTAFPTPQLQINASGNANAHASASLNLAVGVTINGFGLDLGGPSLTAQSGAGVALNALVSNAGGTCNLKLNAVGYFGFQGQADLDFGVDGIGFNYPYAFPTISKTFPSGGWNYTKSEASSFCSNGNFDAGGQQMCVISGHESLCPKATPDCCATGNSTTMNACVDQASDDNNCGLCNYVCSEVNGAGSTCSMGVCSCTCPVGSTAAAAGSSCPGDNIAGCF